jgi:general secretion pathway protein B
MSVILDALKKLDREKSIRRGGSPNIAAEILRPDLPRPEKRILPYVIAICLATAAITYLIMVEFGPLKKPPSLKPTTIPPPSQQVSVALPEPDLIQKSSPPVSVDPPLPSQQALPAPLPREPVRPIQEEIKPVPPKTQIPEETKVSAIPLSEKKIDQKVIPEEVRVAPEVIKKPAEAPPAPPDKPAPAQRSLKISGIVWSEEPSNRLAVINGMPIKEGAIIEGVKVVEILSTHVRFFYNNRSFEVSLGSSTVLKD